MSVQSIWNKYSKLYTFSSTFMFVRWHKLSWEHNSCTLCTLPDIARPSTIALLNYSERSWQRTPLSRFFFSAWGIKAVHYSDMHVSIAWLVFLPLWCWLRDWEIITTSHLLSTSPKNHAVCSSASAQANSVHVMKKALYPCPIGLPCAFSHKSYNGTT